MPAVHEMTDVQALIELRRKQLEIRPLFAGLDASSSMSQLRLIAKQITFYTFGFQDMLRLAHERVKDPMLREIAARLRQGDAGHDQWFVFDLEQLGCKADVTWIFGPEHENARDLTYGLIAELLRAEDDRIRLVFLLVLEAAASVFFWRVVDLIKRARYEAPLRYFARSHMEVEAEHDIFSERGQEELESITYDSTSFAAVTKLIHACFDGFDRMADYLETQRVLADEAALKG